jgi:hypothetical protein
MDSSDMQKALKTIDWNSYVQEFLTHSPLIDEITSSNIRIAIWSKQFEDSDKGNIALPFIREMQIEGYHMPVLTSLALYKPAAASIRNMFESALYYTYFRSHPVELTTLVRDDKYHIDKSDIMEYHQLHTMNFMQCQECFGLLGRINIWYRGISSIIHGQIPGTWIQYDAIDKIKHNTKTLPHVIEKFTEGEEIIHHLFLCTVGKELWNDFSSLSKGILLSGLSAKIRSTLKLDSA